MDSTTTQKRDGDDSDEELLKFDFAIICALAVEAKAVDALFDEYYPVNQYRKRRTDCNVYTTGRIGNHNVVLVHMPGIGKKFAATVATNLSYSFDFKLVFIVGVCGATPWYTGSRGEVQEILLGDIIIGSSIVEYDFGKQFSDTFTRKHLLNTHHGRVGQEILGMLSKLEMPRIQAELKRQTYDYLSTLQKKDKTFQDLGASEDKLFKSTYSHKHQSQECCICTSSGSCDIAKSTSCQDLMCDESHLERRHRLNIADRSPIFHVGGIASGDTVMKSAEHRDEIANQGVIAFEMEGAGAWENTNCIVIKGACDYADSHKSKSWQPYAAATAAAFTKAFLKLWPSTARSITSLPTKSLGMDEAERTKHLNTLDFPERTRRESEIEEAYTHSCQWITEHPKYLEWKMARSGIFGVRGKPGSGKSTLMKKIFRQLKEDRNDSDVILAYFFHRRGTELQHSQLGMFRSLLYMLLHQCPLVQTDFWSTSQSKQKGLDKKWRVEELREIFSSTLINASGHGVIRIFIDALDEAGDQAQKVISYLRVINEKLKNTDAVTSICFSCRHFPIITIKEGFEISLEEHNEEDIARFITNKLNQELRLEESAVEVLTKRLIDRASGMFMWVSLVIPIIVEKDNDGETLNSIYRVIESVPTDLGEVYRHILSEVIKKSIREETLHLMQWILLSKEPLSVKQLRCILASDDSVVKPHQQSHRDSENYIDTDERMMRWITSRTGGLAETLIHEASHFQSRRNTVQFIHQSVIDFLLKDKFHCLLVETKDGIAYGHHRLARSCINYLKWPKTYQVVKTLVEKHQRMYPEESHTETVFEELTFASYANKFWPLHAHKAEQGRISQAHIVSKVQWPSQQFFANCFEIQSCFFNPTTNLSRGLTLFHVASESSLITVLGDLLAREVPLQIADSDGWRATHYAARGGHEKVMQMLVEAKCDLTATTANGQTVLEIAASWGHLKVVQLLLDLSEATIGGQNSILPTALYAAAERGQVAVLEFFITKGAYVNAQSGQFGNALQAAASSRSVECVKLLIDAGAESGPYGNALQAAAARGSAECVKLLIDTGAEVNAQSWRYGNALQAAASSRSAECVKLLIDGGAEVSAQSGPYGNALQAAASSRIYVNLEKGYNDNFTWYETRDPGDPGETLDVLSTLRDARADIAPQAGYFGNSLQAAAASGHADVVKMLISWGSQVNIKGGAYGTVLQAAAISGSVDVVEELLKGGALVNAQGGHFDNALQAAVIGGAVRKFSGSYDGSEFSIHEIVYLTRDEKMITRSLKLVKMLLDVGADVCASGGYFGSALQAAAHRGSKTIFDFLLSAGAKLENQGGHYGTILQYASCGGCIAILETLLESGFDVNVTGGYFGNALQAAAAAQFTSKESVELLLDAGANVNATGGHFGTALQAAAAEYGSDEIVKTLLDAGADVNATGGHFGTALQAAAAAAEYGSDEIVKTLLDAGADVNATGGYFGTALQAAAAAQYGFKRVKMLLDAGADVNATGGRWGCALKAAKESNHWVAVDVLRRAGAIEAA
ncbi:hypothetical protein BP6252_12930 [Coleophoma cylindrospora]|uniref:Uncharacterized protein n=1 Tax=Coleophoma cylindrospora TaxID=1849047 RepID=A0A3D8QDB1_9HELO|nr:hypothetical protein BP6252_12930 [Coleophoma cylindrospora]